MNRLNIVLSVLLFVSVLLTSMSRIDYSRPNIEVLPGMMKYSPAYDSFSANPNFRDGRTLQTPVPGTIARGEMPLDFEATKEDAARAGDVLLNPYHRVGTGNGSDEDEDDASEERAASGAVDSSGQTAGPARLVASVERGRGVYRAFCISCHGPNGAGDGPVAKRGFPPPPSLTTGNSTKMKDGQLFHILTYGQGSMSPLAAQLTRDQRWDVINFVRSMRASAPPTEGRSSQGRGNEVKPSTDEASSDSVAPVESTGPIDEESIE